MVGLDSDAAGVREASHRAARKPPKGGLPNALFVVAAAEDLPGPLAGKADQLTIALPWGSLLRGLARAEPALLDGLRRSLQPGGELELLLSVQPTDAALGLQALDAPAVDALAGAYANLGLRPVEVRSASSDDVERLGSSWAKRLGVPERRPAWLLRFVAAEPARG